MTANTVAYSGFAYSVVERSCATATLTFPHEVGHNMGANHDAFVAVNGVRTKESLKGLRPGESRTFDIPSGGEKLTIGSERLVPGQSIEFDADLKGR